MDIKIRIRIFMKNLIKIMPWSIKRILGVDDFSDNLEIITYLKGVDNTQNYDTNKTILFEETSGLKLWLVSSKTNVFIIKDTGEGRPKILLNRLKKDFTFKMINEKNQPRLFIDNTKTTLPFDISLTGNSQTFETRINQILE